MMGAKIQKMTKRELTRQVKVKDLAIGGQNKVVIKRANQ